MSASMKPVLNFNLNNIIESADAQYEPKPILKSTKKMIKYPCKHVEWTNYNMCPSRTAPENGLPNWERLPLDKKISGIPRHPPGAIHYSRGKLAQTYYPKEKPTDMNLIDPYNRVIGLPYDALHDEHLQKYFQSPVVRKHLQEQGLLDPASGDALCTLQELNTFRAAARGLYLPYARDYCKNQFQERCKRMQLRQLEQKTTQTVQKWNAKVRAEFGAAERREKRKYEQDQKKERHAERLKRYPEIFVKLEARLKEENATKQKCNQSKRQIVSETYQNLTESQGCHVRNHVKWHRQRIKQAEKRREIFESERKAARADEITSRWEAKKVAVTDRLAREQEAYNFVMSEREANIHRRIDAAELSEKRAKQRLEESRIKVVQKRMERSIQVRRNELLTSLLKVWGEEAAEDMNDAEFRIRKAMTIVTANEEHKVGSFVGNTYMSVLDIRAVYEKEKNIPVAVSYAIDCVIERAIEIYAHKFLLTIFNEIVADLARIGKQLQNKNPSKRTAYLPSGILQAAQIRSTLSVASSFTSATHPKIKDIQNEGDIVDKVRQLYIEGKRQTAHKTCICLKSRQSSAPHPRVKFAEDTDDRDSCSRMPLDGKDVRCPSWETLAQLAMEEDTLPQDQLDEQTMNWEEKAQLESALVCHGSKLMLQSKTLIEKCALPAQRHLVIRKLKSQEGATLQQLATDLLQFVLHQADDVDIHGTPVWTKLLLGLTRIAVQIFLDPPELRKPKNEFLVKYRVMYLTPKVQAKINE